MLRARALWQRQRMAEMAVPGAQQKQQRGGAGLDALTERFLRETRALDRDSEHLDDRLRGRGGRRQRINKRRRRGWRDTDDQNGGEFAARGSTGGGGDSSNGTTSAWCGDNNDDGGSSMFLASFNSSSRAPFLMFGAADEAGRGGISSRDDALSTAAAAAPAAAAAATATATAAASSVEAGASGASCRVQSYFTQALGDASLCGRDPS